MSDVTLGLPPALTDWMRSMGVAETPALKALREETMALDGIGNWATAPEQGQLNVLLARMIGARRYVELGTFTGYGTLWIAQSLPEIRVVTCERHEEFAAIARRHWQKAGVDDRIDLRMQDAVDVLDDLIARDGEGSVDMVFIDADKQPYPEYYQRAVRLVRSGGLVLLDNAFRDGGVVDASDTSRATEAIRTVTRDARDDDRVDMAIVPIADGVIVARKR